MKIRCKVNYAYNTWLGCILNNCWRVDKTQFHKEFKRFFVALGQRPDGGTHI